MHIKEGGMITHKINFEKMLVLMYQGRDRWAVSLNEQLCFMGTQELRDLANKILTVTEKGEKDASEAN